MNIVAVAFAGREKPGKLPVPGPETQTQTVETAPENSEMDVMYVSDWHGNTHARTFLKVNKIRHDYVCAGGHKINWLPTNPVVHVELTFLGFLFWSTRIWRVMLKVSSRCGQVKNWKDIRMNIANKIEVLKKVLKYIYIHVV